MVMAVAAWQQSGPVALGGSGDNDIDKNKSGDGGGNGGGSVAAEEARRRGHC